MAALHMGKANTSANLSAVFSAKAEQAKVAQAKGDKATVNKLRKGLWELNLQIFNNKKWMFEPIAQGQTPVVTEKQEDLRSTQIRTSEQETSEFQEGMNVLIARLHFLQDKMAKGVDQTKYMQARLNSLEDKLAKGVNQIKYIQPYVEDDNESDEGDKGFKCEMSGALGDLNISYSTITHKISGVPTSDDLDRLVYDAGDRRKSGPYRRVTSNRCPTFDPKSLGKLVDRANVGP